MQKQCLSVDRRPKRTEKDVFKYIRISVDVAIISCGTVFNCYCNEIQCSFHFSCNDKQHEERRILLGLTKRTALCQRLFLIMTVCDPFFRPHKETEEVLKAKQQNETDSATLVLWDKRKDVSDVTVPPNAHVETLLVSVKII